MSPRSSPGLERAAEIEPRRKRERAKKKITLMERVMRRNHETQML